MLHKNWSDVGKHSPSEDHLTELPLSHAEFTVVLTPVLLMLPIYIKQLKTVKGTKPPQQLTLFTWVFTWRMVGHRPAEPYSPHKLGRFQMKFI